MLLGSACVYCHTIAGTNATGTIGPDLTHLAEPARPRRRDDPEHARLPRRLDPRPAARQARATRCPGTDLSGDELQALLDYLESLR